MTLVCWSGIFGKMNSSGGRNQYGRQGGDRDNALQEKCSLLARVICYVRVLIANSQLLCIRQPS